MQENKGNDKETKTLFVVENGLNTCYIDALLMALFYKSSTYLDSLLHAEPKNYDCIYLQEIIKNKFVDPVRKHSSIMADVVNEIRIYANMCGWLADKYDEFFEQQDVNEFYSFLLDVINVPLIEIQRQTICEGAIDSKNDIGDLELVPFINLIVPNDNTNETSVKELLNSWMNNNTVSGIHREVIGPNGQKKMDYVKGLNIYKIANVPTFVALSLNRFNNTVDQNGNVINKRIETKVNIQKKIKLHHITDSDDKDGLKWSIHSIICHKGTSPKSGHYYSVIYGSDNKWLLFDDLAIPCLRDIDIKDSEIAETIKKESVMMIYCYESRDL